MSREEPPCAADGRGADREGGARPDDLARRAFVRRLPVLTGAAALGTWALEACAGAAYLVPRTEGATLVVSAGTVPSDGAFVARPGGGHPLFVVLEGDTWLAVHARCTHRGCQPEAVGGRLVCPCHGSVFAYDGAVLGGPAREPLRRVPVARSGDDLILRTEGDEP